MPPPNDLTQTFPFTLPRGFVDDAGGVHRQGTMRLATARDELKAQAHPQIRQCPDYLTLVMLSQVITQLGELAQVSPTQLEGLFTQDLAYLRTVYARLNQQGHPYILAHCPDCDRTFEVSLTSALTPEQTPLGEPLATPQTSSMRR